MKLQNRNRSRNLIAHLGSLREVADTNGNIIARFNYDPYGRRTQTFGTLSVDFGFAGLFEHQSGDKFAVWRIYDPNTAKWLSIDPIREQGGWNLYAYCRNDPVNGVDESGLNQTLWIGFGHLWIEVDTYDKDGHKTGTVDLSFLPDKKSYHITPIPPTTGRWTYVFNGFFNSTPKSNQHDRLIPIWRKDTTCEEDSALIQTWKNAQSHSKLPRYDLLRFNCITMSLATFIAETLEFKH